MVVLVNPKGSIDITNNAPMGLYYLSAMLSKADIENRIFDFHNVECIDELKLFLAYHDVILAGITTCASGFYNVVELAKMIKTFSPTTHIVLGGPFASVKCEDILNTYFEIDYVCVGPGEHALIGLYKYLTAELGIEHLTNVLYRNEHNVILRSKIERVLVDSFPRPKREIIHVIGNGDNSKNIKKAEVVTSRGCPYRCRFCYSHASTSQKWICRNVEEVIAEIRELINEHDVNCVVFSDSDFLAAKQRAMTILRSINTPQIRVKFHIASRSDSLLRLDCVEELFELGCELIELGIESGSQSQLNRYGKKDFETPKMP